MPRVAILLLLAACHGKDSIHTDDTATPLWGLSERPSNPDCLARPRPTEGLEIQFDRAFNNLRFSSPVDMVQAPGDDSQWYVVEQGGTIEVFENSEDVASSSTFADLRDRVESGGELGLLGIAFHPDYADNHEVYLSYTAEGMESRVSRFRSTDGGATLDPDTEEILLSMEQPYSNHNGGNLEFGPDGFLYIAFGDGGSAGDPLRTGQDPTDWFASILRIDVDHGDPYDIPADNPFADGLDGAPEVYAYGLRNTWKMSFDRLTGELWAGDVGQNAIEEVDIIVNGGNYGWNLKEGNRCYSVDPCDIDGLIDPVATYTHSVGRSITGGYVYRGSNIPALEGIYIYGDYASGTVFGVFWDEQTGALEGREIADSGGRNISTFAEDQAGELYFTDYARGGVYKIAPVEDTSATPFPRLLSETGCMDPADPSQPGPGLIPYTVNVPLWSDGAEKERWMALPDGQTITIEADDHWTLPIGSVLVKQFRVAGQLVETRLLMRHDDGLWAGYTYLWSEDGSDAVLARAGGSIETPDGTWNLPTSAQCIACHTGASGQSLGTETAQFNGDFTYPNGATSNQIATLDRVGVFASSPGDPAALSTFADPARAYLHVQCAHCHRPNSTAPGELDLRETTPLADMHACGETPNETNVGVEDALILAPGEPERSTIPLRMRASGADRMPPLGTVEIDSAGVALIEDWIRGLPSCD